MLRLLVQLLVPLLLVVVSTCSRVWSLDGDSLVSVSLLVRRSIVHGGLFLQAAQHHAFLKHSRNSKHECPRSCRGNVWGVKLKAQCLEWYSNWYSDRLEILCRTNCKWISLKNVYKNSMCCLKIIGLAAVKILSSASYLTTCICWTTEPMTRIDV